MSNLKFGGGGEVEQFGSHLGGKVSLASLALALALALLLCDRHYGTIIMTHTTKVNVLNLPLAW